jgi:hypothetical protein
MPRKARVEFPGAFIVCWIAAIGRSDCRLCLMKLYFLVGISLFVCAGACCATEVGGDEELLGIVAQKLSSHSEQSIAPYFDRTFVTEPSLLNIQKLKKISAFGMIFSGSAEVKDGHFMRVEYSTDDSQISRADAETALKAIASKLEQTFGPVKIADVPNFDDGPQSYRVFWWRVGDEMILLSLEIYSGRRVNLTRIKQSVWLAHMGSEREFWETALKTKD